MTIESIYHQSPIVIRETQTIEEAINLMTERSVNSLIVVNSRDSVVGIITVEDIAGAVVPQEFKENVQMAEAMYTPHFFVEACEAMRKKHVSQIMRKNFISVTLKTNIMAIAADFLRNDLYVVPVIENNVLIGIITRTQILKAIKQSLNL